MNTNIVRILVICILGIATVNCQRAKDEGSSNVSLQLPVYSNLSSFSCTKCLKAIMVNVDGENLKPVRYFDKLERLSEAAAELNSEVNLEVPSGSKRKIQVLAIYRLSTGALEAQYGSVVTDLVGEMPPPIVLSLQNLGPFKGGSLMGRYLTGVNSGPTGRVIVSMTHAASGLNMDLFTGEILDGWFNFFASENFLLSYRLANGIPLPPFQNVSLDSLTPSSVVDHISRIYRPDNYFTTQDGWSTFTEVNETHDIIYGYFGLAALTAAKSVCLDYNPSVPAGSTFTNLSFSNTGTPQMNYHHSDNTADLYGFSGKNTNDGVCSGSLTANRYNDNLIFVGKNQLNGNGNDTAKAMAGAFTYVSQSGVTQKYLVTVSGSLNFTFKGLPGLFAASGAMFDGVQLYVKPSAASGGYDEVRCDSAWLAAKGFTQFTSFTTAPAVTSNIVTFSMNAPSVTDGFILCPTTGGVMSGLGGFYVGSLQ